MSLGSCIICFIIFFSSLEWWLLPNVSLSLSLRHRMSPLEYKIFFFPKNQWINKPFSFLLFFSLYTKKRSLWFFVVVTRLHPKWTWHSSREFDHKNTLKRITFSWWILLKWTSSILCAYISPITKFSQVFNLAL